MMTQERKNQLYEKMLSWVLEHVKNDKELFRILHEELGMTQEELHDNSIESLDYLFEAQKIDDTVGKISVIGLHQDDEDYFFTSEYNNTFFRTAKLYHRFSEQKDKNLTLDSIGQLYFGAQQEIEPIIFNVLLDAMEHDDRVNVIIEIDLDEGMMSVMDKSGVQKTYCLDDVVTGIRMVNRNAGKAVNPFTERMFLEIMEGNEVDIISRDTETEVTGVQTETVSTM